MSPLVHLRNKTVASTWTGGSNHRRASPDDVALGYMFYAYDAGVISQSSEKRRKMMGGMVVVYMAFGFIVLGARIGIMCLRTQGMPEPTTIFSVEAAGQMFIQTNEFVYLGGNVNHNADLSIEVDRRMHTQRMVQLLEVHPRIVQPTERYPRA